MATQQWKYHVFISFRGEDTRLNFVCHLDKALRRTGLNTFVDNQLQRGEEINTALVQAIQDSKVALIIFSENYASSSWCLDELLKIIECGETHNQIVIPVFYRVNPSDVRKQNGSFQESFAKHIENPRYSNKIQKWKDALTKAANISGMGPDVNREDNKLIDQIVKDVSEKLKHLYPCSLERFVGLKSKISEVKTLLATGSSDVRMLGIWGMGGIGKTTLAQAIFAEVSSQFEGRSFVNVREELEKGGIQKLLEKLISELLEERDVKIYTPIVGPGLYILERLKSKKVFVVFDDATDRSQLKRLIGNPCWFGAGSNIIITSRDKQVLQTITEITDDNIYEVKALSDTKSRQLFERNAFKEKQPLQDHIPLIDSFVNYARGNPLAIEVLGSFVCGKGVELWEDALTKLLNCPDNDIQNVLKLSYEGLDREEKAIFLHIACFFKGENVNEAKRVFPSCGLSADIEVSRLVDKSLLTISVYHDKLHMHDLLQGMGREIVRQESKDPRRRSRLWDAKEIQRVFEEIEGAGKLKAAAQSLIESPLISCVTDIIFGMLPFGIGNIKVPSSSCQFFSKITRLNMRYCENLKSFPNNVDLQCLEILDLWACSNLIVFSEISTNLRKLNVGATAIKEVHSSSIEGLSRLQELEMAICTELESLPSNICKLQALQILNLGHCSSLKKFPEILEPMYNLRRVKLSNSGIEAIPSSIDNMKGLESLELKNCLNLAYFPENFGNLVRGIADFWFNTAFKQRMFKILNVENLDCFFFHIHGRGNCRQAGHIDDSFVTIGRGNCHKVEMRSHISEGVFYLIDLSSHPCLRFLSPNYYLDLSHCSIKELPKDLGSLYYLRELDLRSNNFEEIPTSIKQLSLLEFLQLDDCPKLRSLPQLPTSLCYLTAVQCESLKTLLAFKQPIFNGCKMDFENCFKLEEKECEAMVYKLLRNWPKDVLLRYLGGRIPEWFKHETTGDIITIKLPSNWFINRRFFGVAFCFVLRYPHIRSMWDDFTFECYFENNCNPTILFPYQSHNDMTIFNHGIPSKQQHVVVVCVHDFNVWISERRQLFDLHCINMASFKFHIRPSAIIKKCGITPLYMQVDEGCSGIAPLYMQVDEGCSGIAPLYMQVDEGYVQGDDDDHDENTYWMLESLLPRTMSTKMKMKLQKKDKDYDEDMNSEDIDDDMIPEDDEDENKD